MKKRLKMNKNMKHYMGAFLLFLFLASGIAQASDDVMAQTTVTARFNNVTLNDVLWELKKQTDFTFIYSTNDVKEVKIEELNVAEEDVTNILDKCLENTNLTYTLHNGVIAIRKAAPKTEPARTAPQQQKPTLQGSVLDETGEPLLGVNIMVKGTTLGAVTDIDGNFILTLNKNEPVTIQVSYIGYQTQELRVSPGQTMRIVMKDDAEVLGEVVVTGYGTFKKSAFAGSASTIKMNDKIDVPATDFKSLMQGSAPGVQVTSTSGAPGGSTSITIRGLGSFNASTSPLYVIDGVPVMTSISTSSDAGTDIMSSLNTSDIENITVIKDAAAASLYGSRAANGVVVITTKSGKEGKPQFNLKADWGFSKYSMPFREVMGGQERRDTFWEGLYNQGRYLNKLSDEDARSYADKNIDAWAPYPQAPEGMNKSHPEYYKWASIVETGWEDWEKALFNDSAPYENYEFSASGGDKKTSYYTSLSYNNQDGIVRQQGFERITGRVNVKYKMTDKLQVGANVLYSKMTQLSSSETLTYTSPMYSSRHKNSPSDPIYNLDGTYNENLLENGKRNAKSQLDLNYKKTTVDRSFNTIFANYTFIEGLVFNTTFSIDRINEAYKSWTDPRSTDGKSDNGSMSMHSSQYDKMVWKNNLMYDRKFGSKHNTDFLLGYEIEEQKRKYLSGSIKDFATVEKHNISNGANISGLSGYTDSGWRLVSYLGRVNYNYDNKYYLGASARVDGSSRLHRDSRWGTFWSVSGAWRLSSEAFMESIQDVLNDARIRVSYGSNGTLPSDYYGYLDLVQFGYKYNTKPGMLESQIGNKDLKWEKNYNLNVGVDFRLFDRIGITVEGYQRRTSDLLNNLRLSSVTGFSSLLTNIGEVENTGIEVDLNADILRTKDFSWNSALNFGHNKNKIIALGNDQTEITGSSTIRRVGESYYSFYVKEFAGIDSETGYPTYYINDPENLADRSTTNDAGKANYILYKHADPTISGGWTNSLRYKWFDLSFLWTFTLGGHSYDSGASKLEHAGKSEKGAIQTLYRDRWRQPGDQTNIEMFMVGNPYSMASVVNSRRIHSTDHLRLKSLTFGVAIPKTWAKKAYLENVRFFFSGTNLLTFAKYKNYDPEVGRSGSVDFGAPKMKTLTFGVDVKF
ncbi:TonB-linked SusC/RagA family outer membrane protein [Parabacteroides sp. PFB2-12]|nr:TonB-linked SusC/RagA family outer membrane protein [Parabacteroides sp. PM6-13]MDH6392137.1 TonB-linked SusC/RagA family outer membrane protein [Parabacteroides sp. PFB2-12]